MPGPAELVTAFISGWDAPGGLAAAIRDYFTPDTVWENVGFSRTTGPDEAMAVLSGFGSNPDEVAMRVDMLAIATIGDKVLTERIDHLLDAEGRSMFAFPLMGIFEISGDKIVAWRDYFDTAGFPAQSHG